MSNRTDFRITGSYSTQPNVDRLLLNPGGFGSLFGEKVTPPNTKSDKDDNQNSRYVAREARNVQELEAMLRLRYKEFLPVNVIAENPYEIDLDYFDQNAYHIGLFREESGISTAIGTMRVVTSMPTPHYCMIQEVASNSTLFTKRLDEKPKKPLPLLNYAPFPEALDQFEDDAHSTYSGVFEGSRYCIRKEDASIRLATFLMEVSTAISFALLPNFIWCIGSRTRHEAWYKSYGYQRIAGTDRFDHPCGQAILLSASAESLPIEKRLRIESMKSAFEAQGQVCMNATQTQHIEKNFHA